MNLFPASAHIPVSHLNIVFCKSDPTSACSIYLQSSKNYFFALSKKTNADILFFNKALIKTNLCLAAEMQTLFHFFAKK
jgi:hypothetical protein